jgi:hypothetical protein
MEKQQEIKLYRNGKTYEENVRSGVFIPKKHLDNHKEVMTEIADLKAIVMKLLNNMDR